MAVEINELVIRAVAVDDEASSSSSNSSNGLTDPEVFQALVTACVEEVKKMLERKTNR